MTTRLVEGGRQLKSRTAVLARATTGPLTGRGAQSGQGTVEYVGLILLVSLLMVGMVAAMKGFSGTTGKGIHPNP